MAKEYLEALDKALAMMVIRGLKTRWDNGIKGAPLISGEQAFLAKAAEVSPTPIA